MMYLSNKRQPGESFDAFVKRRKADTERLKQYLKGRLIHESTRYFHLAEDNAEYVRLAAAGLCRDVKHWTATNGDKMVTFRMKGQTYAKPVIARKPITGVAMPA